MLLYRSRIANFSALFNKEIAIMKSRFVAVMLISLYAGLCAAQSTTPASEASIKELLNVMGARQLVDSMLPQLQSMMKNTTQQALHGQTPTPEQQKVLETMQNKVMTIYKEQMTWEKLEPMYVRIYQATFSQSELDGMLGFYRSPAGQAMVKKMPLALQNSMTEMQKLMTPMMKAIEDAAREVRSAEKASTAKPGAGDAH